jgi:C_GCAxxG_C_C family probable redox protein
MTSHGEKAVACFAKGYNCAQSTAYAFAEEAGLEAQALLNMMSGFGGGVVSGMVFALGLLNEPYDPLDISAKTRLYEKVRRGIGEFRGEFGTTCCKELLLKAGCLPKPEPSVRNAEYYAKRPCAHFVEAAAEIAARILASPLDDERDERH